MPGPGGEDDDPPDDPDDEIVAAFDAALAAEPNGARGVRRRKRRTRRRSVTLRRLSAQVVRLGWGDAGPLSASELAERPRVRADCEGDGHDRMRPCPWVGCKHHLYLDINPDTGTIKINFPDLEPWEMEHTCALDVAERGGITLEEVGEIMNLTRERIRQIEVRGLIKMKMSSPSGSEELGKAPAPAALDKPRRRRRD